MHGAKALTNCENLDRRGWLHLTSSLF